MMPQRGIIRRSAGKGSYFIGPECHSRFKTLRIAYSVATVAP
jgi:hypothetical protein